MMNDEYLIYCRKKNAGEKFGPMDLQGGEYGVKLIYASLFESLSRAKEVADSLAKQNREYDFQVRKYGKDRPVYVPEV